MGRNLGLGRVSRKKLGRFSGFRRVAWKKQAGIPDLGVFLGRNTGQPHQIKTTRLRDLCTPTEISRTSVFDLRTPTEISRTSVFDLRTPTEISRTGGFDHRTPTEISRTGVFDLRTPTEISRTSVFDLRTPTEISRTGVFDLRTPTEISRTSVFDLRTPTEIYRTGGFDLMRLPWEETGCNSRFGRVAWKKQARILDLGVFLGRNRPDFRITADFPRRNGAAYRYGAFPQKKRGRIRTDGRVSPRGF